MIKGKAEIVFGMGDIRISPILHEGNGICVLDNQKPHKIGEIVPTEDVFTIRDKDVMITFSNVESLDVVIDRLMELKRLMIDGKQEGDIELYAELDGFWKGC